MGRKTKQTKDSDSVQIAETPTEVLAICRYKVCTRIASDGLLIPYCSNACKMFDTGRGKKVNKYSATFASSKLHEYLRECEESHYPRLRQVAGTMVPVRSIKVPTIKGYGVFLGGISDTLLHKWARKYTDFNKALNLIDSVEFDSLVSNGLSGAYNSKMASLMLMSHHNMSEKVDTQVTGGIGVVKSVYERADEMQHEEVNAIDKYVKKED